MDDLTKLKLVFLLVMIIFTLIAGLLPVKVLKYLRYSAAHAASSKQHKHVSLILCLLTCFSGGVFLATCFLHLFPELLESWNMINEKHFEDSVQYPIAELLSCVGFFLLFFVEELVIIVIPSFAHHVGHGHGHGHSHGHVHGNGNLKVKGQAAATDSDPLVSKSADNGCCMTGTFTIQETPIHHDEFYENRAPNRSETEDPILETGSTVSEGAGHCQTHCPLTVHSVHRRRYSGEGAECKATTPELFTAIALAEPERCETNCEKVDEDPPILMKSSPHAHSHGVRSITFVLALSFHSVIEGIALGNTSSSGDAITLFFSLLIHKLIVAFSVGLQLARTHAHALHWVVASVFILAVMSPLGAVVGILIQGGEGFANDMMSTVFQGLAVGTFIYVTFFEVLLHERDNEHPNMLKLLFIIIGFALIGCIRLAEGGHSHDHGNGYGHSHSHDENGTKPH